MTTQQIQLNDKVRNLNLQINQQLKRAGVLNAKMNVVKPLSELPNSEWKNWIAELIEYRNKLESQLA